MVIPFALVGLIIWLIGCYWRNGDYFPIALVIGGIFWCLAIAVS